MTLMTFGFAAITRMVVLALIVAAITAGSPRSTLNVGGPLLTGARVQRGVARTIR